MPQARTAKRKKVGSTDPGDDLRTVALTALGANIRSRREALMNQEAFAAECGLARGYYGSVERGEHNTAFLNLCRIAIALDCELSELMPTLAELKAAAKR